MDKQREKYFTVNEVTVGDKGIGATDKLLFSFICSMAKREGYCFANNGYMAKIFNVTKVTISRQIARLRNAGFITVELHRSGDGKLERWLIPSSKQMLTAQNTEYLPQGQQTVNSSGSRIFNREIKGKVISKAVVKDLSYLDVRKGTNGNG